MSWQVGLYVAVVLIPLAAFLVEFLAGRYLKRANALIATGAIGLSFVLSLVGFVDYFFVEAKGVFAHHAEAAQAEAGAEVAKEAQEKGKAAEPGHGAEGAGGSHAKVPPPPLVWQGRFTWVAVGANIGGRTSSPLAIELGVHVDNLAVIMFLMVTFIATLIHVYSMGYMHDDPRYPLFFTYLSLFCFSMLGLVASDNIFMIFVFWELVGVCSYLLIGFWYEDKKNSDAANKAFITNRVGDVGMLLGLGLLWSSLGTFNVEEINRGLRGNDGAFNVVPLGDGPMIELRDQATGTPKVNEAGGEPRRIPAWLLTVAGLGIFAGCVGKSAQFPLHVWLPDAMAGPTPVSAMVHAATMVAAGVYLVGRFFPVFTEPALLYIAYTGGITLFIAATIAMVQTDYKKVLAYSTVSQLGFMMLGLGVGGRAAGLFHLLTHAFFKALLFLGAGSVYHAVHTYEMPVLGGLQKKMPRTALTMLLATMAISGVPLFSGFYSKDAILASSMHFVFERGNYEHILLFLLPVVGAAITAFYMFRMWFLVFGGESRGYPEGHHDQHSHGHGHHDPHPSKHAHESGPLMVWPLILLAVPTVMIGWPWLILPLPGFNPVLEQLLEYGEPVVATDLENVHLFAVGASLLIGIVGIGLGFLYYSPWTRWKRLDAARTAARFNPVYNFLVHKWYFDELYRAVLIGPTLKLARWISVFDRRAVDGVVNGAARATERLSWLSGRFDGRFIDGAVNGFGALIYKMGDVGRRLQTGLLRNYLMFLAVAVVGLFAGVFAWVLG